MQDLGKYTKKTHVAIQNRYVSLLAVGSIALVALVFTLGILVGSRQVEDKRCPEIDPLAALDLKAKEPLPPAQKEGIRFSFHDSLQIPKDQVPTPASLLSSESSDKKENTGDGTGMDATPLPLKTPRMTESPTPEKVGNDEPGIYSLQVGSFNDRLEATRMARKLERAGHQTFLVSVNMPDRGGLWYRVRVGPFGSKSEAWSYKRNFEEREKLPAFVVKRRARV